MPEYDKLGKTTIDPEVLHTIARLTALNIPGVSRMAHNPPVRVNRLFKRAQSEGVMIDIQDDVVFADLYIVLSNGVNIRDVSRDIQREVARAISDMVGMQVGRVNIHVEDIDYPPENEAEQFMKPRTKARSVALQVLYEIDITGHPPELVLADRLEDMPMDSALVEFCRQIILGILPLVERLDHFIAIYAPEWPLDQVASIDRNILRIALWEMAASQETPIKVAINEAVELAKVYGSDSTPRFVNGVLGSLAAHQNEIVQALKSSS